MRIRIKKKTLKLFFAGLIVLTLVLFLVSKLNLWSISSSQQLQNGNLLAVFLTGLFAGALTCLAVQGGLLATSIAQREEEKLKDKTKSTGNALPILSFLVAKLGAYTVLGLLLGWFGSLFQLSLTANIAMQLMVGIFMLGTALNLLNVHPVFRYFIIQPPRFLTRMVRNQSKSGDFFGPALLGAFTVFIPCGTTQAMMALAVASGNPFSGAAILFAFILGTSPLFFALGYFATKLGESLQQKFMKVAALALIILAVFNLNNVLALTGSSWTINNSFKQSEKGESIASNVTPQQSVVIDIQEAGYSPNVVTVKAGTNVSFQIKNDRVYTCASALTIPYFNYQRVISAGKTETIALKMPDKPTQIPFMCSMGMYRGMINVI